MAIFVETTGASALQKGPQTKWVGLETEDEKVETHFKLKWSKTNSSLYYLLCPPSEAVKKKKKANKRTAHYKVGSDVGDGFFLLLLHIFLLIFVFFFMQIILKVFSENVLRKKQQQSCATRWGHLCVAEGREEPVCSLFQASEEATNGSEASR